MTKTKKDECLDNYLKYGFYETDFMVKNWKWMMGGLTILVFFVSWFFGGRK